MDKQENIIEIKNLTKSYKMYNSKKARLIEAIIPSDNIGSIKVAEKCGMKIEATLKNRYKNKISGRINDLLIYSIFNNTNN